MEQKNKAKAILLAILVVTTIVVYWFLSRDEKPVVDKGRFRLSSYESIDKVTFQSNRDTVALSFNGSRWKVNENYNADRSLIQVLFATLQQAEPRRPLTGAEKDSVKMILSKEGVTVTLFSAGQEQQRFIAGGNPQKTNAYFEDVATSEIYVMHIPGYRVYVSGIMELSANQWRDKLVFGLNWQNFEKLEVEFPEKPEENFTVSMGKTYFEVKGMAKTDTAKLNTFLDNISLLTASEVVGEGRVADSLKALKPFMVIRALDIGKKEFALSVYKESGSTIAGLVQQRDAVLFNRQKIQRIIRPKSFFVSR